MGAVTLASIGTGVHSNFETANTALAKYSAPYHPDPKYVDAYSQIFEIYKDSINKNADLGKRLTNISDRLEPS